MSFEWDPAKASANVKKHGMTFDEAATVFLDPMALSGPDPDTHRLSHATFLLACPAWGIYWRCRMPIVQVAFV